MEDAPKFNFQKHISPKGNKKYVFKIVFYSVFLAALLVFLFYKLKTEPTPKPIQKLPEEIQVIEGIRVLPEQKTR